VSRRALLRSVALALALASVSAAGALEEPAARGWRPFSGTWSASGHRRSVAVESGAAAAVVDVSGAVVLGDGDGLSRGFLGRAVGYDDGHGLSVGRCVWTDEKGDRVFSRLEGETLAAGRRFVGTITGGTGRYAALQGEYSFTWQYVVSTEDGLIEGRAVGLSGRVRGGEPAR
jgi:hypothetical protein